MGRMLTRQEFYNQVWSEPVTLLAVRLQVPVYRIMNLCRWHVVPMPTERYWKAISSGDPATKTPLRALGEGGVDIVDLDSRYQPRTLYVSWALTR